MSALRSAARIKPIVLLKAGRHAGGLAAVETHSGMAAGSDIVFEAAVRRAGVVRVKNIGQLFYAAKALASKFRPQGKRLAIITNGGGPGAMAADRAGDLEIPLAELSASTMQTLNAKMPPTWSQRNPVDIEGDATPKRYHDAILAVAEDDGRRWRAGHALAAGHDAADGSRQGGDRSRPADRQTDPHLLDGRGTGSPGTRLLEDAGIPSFRMPETAIELYYHISTYYWNQKLLLQTPSAPCRSIRARKPKGPRC
jgi:acetyltransferase